MLFLSALIGFGVTSKTWTRTRTRTRTNFRWTRTRNRTSQIQILAGLELGLVGCRTRSTSGHISWDWDKHFKLGYQTNGTSVEPTSNCLWDCLGQGLKIPSLSPLCLSECPLENVLKSDFIYPILFWARFFSMRSWERPDLPAQRRIC